MVSYFYGSFILKLYIVQIINYVKIITRFAIRHLMHIKCNIIIEAVSLLSTNTLNNEYHVKAQVNTQYILVSVLIIDLDYVKAQVNTY